MEYKSIIDGQSGEQALAELIEARGPYSDVIAASEDLASEHVDKVPNLLIDLWLFYGAGALEDRKFWFPVPGSMASVMDLLFRNDPDFKQDTYAIAYGAMGNLLCWNRRHGLVMLTSKNGFAQAPGLFSKERRKSPDEELLEMLTRLDPFFFDAMDSDEEPMLERAIELLKPLESGEVFAILPVRNSTGPTMVNNVEIMPVVDHWTNIAINQVFILHDVEGGRFNVREIKGVAG